MYKTYSVLPKIAFVLLVAIFSQKASANINAIDFSKVNYPTALQDKIDF